LIKLKSKIEKDGKGGDVEKEISNIINTHTQLRSKRELIEKFISQNIPEIEDTDSIPQEFDKFWIEEQRIAFNELVKSENLSVERTEQLIENYLFAEREPLRDEILDLIDGEKPTLLNRKKVGDSILKKIMDFVETFINGMDG
jgi:type I restriction enzyme R subunit